MPIIVYLINMNNTFCVDPLEQFSLFILFNVPAWSNFSLWLLIHSIILIFAFKAFSWKITFSKGNISILITKLLDTLTQIQKVNLNLKRYPIYIVFTVIPCLVLQYNLSGIVMYTHTITSSLLVTLLISSSVFWSINILGHYINKSKYYLLFVPSGVPLMIVPLLIPIEIMSYYSRIISLATRLFANMMSGHALLKILLGFSWIFLKSLNSITIVSFIFPLGIVLAVTVLETAIAFLQAYVLMILLLMYLKDAIHLH